MEIDYEMMNDITGKIIGGLRKIFGRNDFELFKLYQNIRINGLSLLGKRIPSHKIPQLHLFIARLVNKYIESLPRRGEAVGILAAQSLIQPITQSLLKAQHSAGKKNNGDDTGLIKLNSMSISTRIITLHLKDSSKEKIENWAHSSQYCTFREILTKQSGECEYSPGHKGQRKRDIRTADGYLIYANVPKTCEIFYVFHIDKDKLKEIGLTAYELFDIIFTFNCFGLIIHPLHTNIFELCPNNITSPKVIGVFNDKIRELMNTRIKGIKGVQSIQVKEIKPQDVVKFGVYDSASNTTKLYVLPEFLLFFPLDELSKRIGRKLTKSSRKSTEPLHLIVEGVYNLGEMKKELYYYLSVKGDSGILTLKSILDNNPGLFRRDYAITNDPHEMRDFLGIISAQTLHEYNYYVSAKSNKFSLAFPHIHVFCCKMFAGLSLKPTTPKGFESMEGINPLDKFSHQNYIKHLSTDPLKTVVKYSAKGLITSTLLGGKFGFGSNYASFRINDKARREIIDLCSKAKTEQYYEEKYRDIDFFGVGKVNHKRSGLVIEDILPPTILHQF